MTVNGARMALYPVVALLAASIDVARAVEIRIAETAVTKVMLTELYKNDGKWHLVKPDRCNDPYLETPSVQISRGRLIWRTRLAGRIGATLGGICVSAGEPTWIRLSARPIVEGTTLSLVDVRIDELEKPQLRAVVAPLVETAMGSNLKLDLQRSIATMLATERTAPYVVELSKLNLRLIQADQGQLAIALEFDLAIR